VGAVERALEHNPGAVMLSCGDPSSLAERIRHAGAALIIQVSLGELYMAVWLLQLWGLSEDSDRELARSGSRGSTTRPIIGPGGIHTRKGRSASNAQADSSERDG
jgi:hypothetical protein